MKDKIPGKLSGAEIGVTVQGAGGNEGNSVLKIYLKLSDEDLVKTSQIYPN